MQQKDMERFAFLYMCGQKDRDLLSGKKRMTFQDFNRLVYLTDFLGLCSLSLNIWNRFSPQFQEQLEELENQLEDDYRDMESGNYEDNIWSQEEWADDFCRSAPNRETREFLRNIFHIFDEGA